VYVRYLKNADGTWRFSGEYIAHINETNLDRPHKVVQRWDKPFLVVENDQTQGGFALLQGVEDWFDLTQPDFAPVFSNSPRGSFEPFTLLVGREWTSTAVPLSPEVIQLTIGVRDVGFTMNYPVSYIGTYQRRDGEKKFALINSLKADGAPVPAAAFEALGDGPNMTPEQLLAQALSGLRKLAASNDAEGKQWLTLVLENVMNTPEKRELEKLLAPNATHP